MSKNQKNRNIEARQYYEDWNRYEMRYRLAAKKASQCECGVDKVGHGRHSEWCRKSELDKYQEDVK